MLKDRNRGDFRFVQGRPFSARYRNRLWVKDDVILGKVAVTPYVYDEIFFDGRYGAWTANRVAFGMQFSGFEVGDRGPTSFASTMRAARPAGLAPSG